ncbi:MAG TPA: SufD family Fe-S cluster assembly protein, partial [Kosmotoga arenicorallina]|nr:SufD family Fe-S cluster assembly protein [Kosmotoga arenicorallina]
MIESNYQREFEKIAEYYEKSGGDASRFLRRDIVSIIVSGDKVIGRNTVEGVELKAKGLENGVEIWLEVKDGIQVENPIHLCTG